MKLELPDNNASVLFHMGNALQSIAKDLDVERVGKLTSHVHTGVSGMTPDEISDTVDKMIESVAADWKVPVNRLTGNTTDAEQYGKSVLSDCLDSIDNMTDAIAAEHEIPVNLLLGVSDTIDADGLPWDQRIHSRGKTRLADNTWRMARKPNDKSDEEWVEYVECVKTELRALMAIPVAAVEPLHDCNGEPSVDQGCDAMAQFVEAVTPRTITVNLPGVVHAVEINGTLEFPPIVDSATFEAVANSDIGAGQPVRIVTPPIVEAPEVVTPPVDAAVIAPPIDAAVVTPPVDAAVVTPPIVEAPEVVTGPTTFPELMKFITVNNKKLTKESVDEALKAQGLASIALLAARTDLIPQVHAALVKLL